MPVRYRVQEHEFGILISSAGGERLHSRATARAHASHLAHGAQRAAEQGRLVSPEGYGMPGREPLTPAQAWQLAAMVFGLACALDVADAEDTRVELLPVGEPDANAFAVRIAENDEVAADVIV